MQYFLINLGNQVVAKRIKHQIKVDGHADKQPCKGIKDSNACNQALSEKRALAVKATLLSSGVSDTQIITKGYGSTVSAVKGSKTINEPKDRRVEIFFKKIDSNGNTLEITP